jgi:hypothetical protein
MSYEKVEKLRLEEKTKMVEALMSIYSTFNIAKKSQQEIDSSEDDELSKIARTAGIGKFFLDMVKQDLEIVGLL